MSAKDNSHPCLLGALTLATKKATSAAKPTVRREQPRLVQRVPEVEAELVKPASGPQCLRDVLEDRRKPAQCRLEVDHFTVKNWGARHENEDRWMSQHDECASSQVEFHTIGVLDGHDSDCASDMVSRLLPGKVARLLKDGVPVAEAYTSALAELEDTLKRVTASAGTCVLSCTLAGRYLWCANLGDCRAGLFHLEVPEPLSPSRSGPGVPPELPKVSSVQWLSRDHKASAPYERQRIAQAGGVVVDGRVEGLEPSRTLGDFDVKAQVKRGVVSIVPEVRRAELPCTGLPSQSVLICATDGVWDVVNGQDICRLINNHKELAELKESALTTRPPSYSGQDALRDLAQEIVQLSIAKGSRDDCTCVAALVTAFPGRGEHLPPL